MATGRTFRANLLSSVWRGALPIALLAGTPLLSSACMRGGDDETAATTWRARAALAGRDGAVTIATPNVVVNQYGVLSKDAAAQATSVTVASVAALANGTAALAPGDLLLVIQMQGATIATTNDSSYGAVSSLGGAGNYELVEVLSVDATTNTIALNCSLKRAYKAAGATQVVRVPQYTTLTVAAGASITAKAWDGSTGGIAAIHAQQTVTIDGAIDVSAKGFRGGAADNDSAADTSDIALYTSASSTDGGRKGEGIAGLVVAYGRGAPANGGGGGNGHNAGGGGGANGRSGAAWRGQGVFDNSVAGGRAWQLDPGYRASALADEGGGRGGYTYSYIDKDARTVRPGDASWGGNNRRERGGLGGHPVDNDPATRLFLGGGGGAGDGNDGLAGRGGTGGGIALVIAGSVTGSGKLIANGENGADAGNLSASGDGPGGAGAGGAVVVQASTLSGFSVEAKGGNGGRQSLDGTTDPVTPEAEGPGGGGGGGYVALSTAMAASPDVSGGKGGTTNAPALSEFPSNGATNGGAGNSTIGSAMGAVPLCTGAAPETSIDATPANPSTSRTAAFSFSARPSGATFECKLDSATAYTACPAHYTPTELADGQHTLLVRARDSVGYVDSTPARYAWTIDATSPDTVLDKTPASATASPTATFAFSSPDATATFECRLDASAWAACQSPLTTGALADGAHTVDVRAKDATGNVDATPATFAWSVLTTAPNTDIVDGPRGVTNIAAATFSFTSTAAQATFECQLDANAYTACGPGFSTGPLGDGKHSLNVRSKDVVGNVDVSPAQRDWEVDTTPPDSRLANLPPLLTTAAVQSFAFGSDEGTVTFECRLDGASYGPCPATWATPSLADGAHTLDVRATDAAGNTDSSPASFTWVVDSVPPDTSITGKPGEASTDPQSAFAFGSNDPAATFECDLDRAGYVPCQAAYLTPPLANGLHALVVRAKDPAGNVDATPAAFTWTVAIAVVQTTVVGAPTGPSSSPIGTFSFTSNQTAAAFECSLDGANFEPCAASGYSTPSLADGPHTLRVRATDGKGNVDPTPATYGWTVDTLAPETVIQGCPAGAVNVNSGLLSFTSNEAGPTFECSLDSATYVPCAATGYPAATQPDGQHVVLVRAKDPSGNVDRSAAACTYVIDTVAPTTAIVTRPLELEDNPVAQFRFATNDPTATFECGLDSAPFAACSSTYATPPLGTGIHTLQVRAKDPAGNVDLTPAAQSWRILLADAGAGEPGDAGDAGEAGDAADDADDANRGAADREPPYAESPDANDVDGADGAIGASNPADADLGEGSVADAASAEPPPADASSERGPDPVQAGSVPSGGGICSVGTPTPVGTYYQSGVWGLALAVSAFARRRRAKRHARTSVVEVGRQLRRQ